MFHDVGCHFGYGNGDLPAIRVIQASELGQFRGCPASLSGVGLVHDVHCKLSVRYACYFHRTTVTFVPSPTRDLTSNSFTSRFAPPRPRPKPDPVVKPSRRAKSISGIPGPWSSKINRSPTRGPFSVASSIWPPCPWINVLRASSLAAVTTLV